MRGMDELNEKNERNEQERMEGWVEELQWDWE